MADFRTTSVFKKNLIAYNAGADLIVNQGGTRSSKSWSIMQLLLIIAVNSQKRLVISVVSRSLPHLKLGVMRDFDQILLTYGINPEKIKNKSNNFYSIGQSVIEFFGADQLDKVHGPARDILFVNESNYLKIDVYRHLEVRTNGTVFIDFNPSNRFWVHDEIIPHEPHTFIQSTFRDNECLPPKILQRILSKQHNEAWWRVYGEGQIGELEGLVFSNYRFGDFNETLPYGYGMDYGFHPDPDACARIAIDNKRKKMYWDEIIYETSQGTEELRGSLIAGIPNKNSLIVAESASPRTNHDLKQSFPNLVRVSKTKTVAEWLRMMQDYEHIITPESYNIEKEFSNYTWLEKKAGVPIDEWNHIIDAGRYYFMKTKQRRSFQSSQS